MILAGKKLNALFCTAEEFCGTGEMLNRMTTTREYVKPFSINCRKCGHVNIFEQRYAYHAGFADQGFLYNDDGNLTLVWSAYDPDWEKIVGKANPWVITEEKRKAFEDWLPPAPKGGKWSFKKPGRCLDCKAEITPPIGRNIYYVLYSDSIVVDGHNSGSLKDLVRT